jgi:phospholipase C
MSPWIEAGTVFCPNTDTPLDHTSVLATVHDWFNIPAAKMLLGKRIVHAPTLDYVLTRSTSRADKLLIDTPAAPPVISTTLPISDLQKNLITGTAAWSGMDSRGRFQGSRHDSTLSTSSLKEH